MISSLALAAALLAAPAAPPASPPPVVVTPTAPPAPPAPPAGWTPHAPPPAVITPVAPPAPPAPPRPPSARAVAYLKAIRFEQTLDRVYAQLTPMFGLQAVTSLEADPKTRAFASELFQKLPGGRNRFAQLAGEEFQRELRKTYPAIDAAYGAAVDSHFTPAEIDELTRFFSGGAGAKYLDLQAPMQAEMETFLRGLGMQAGIAAGIGAVRRAAREAGMKPVERTS